MLNVICIKAEFKKNSNYMNEFTGKNGRKARGQDLAGG